jgi:DNA-directed RNA polymerase alpha subunit
VIPCPECGAIGHRVIESRYQLKAQAKRRRCVCKTCGHRFNTQERVWTGNLEPFPEPVATTPQHSKQELEWLARLANLEARLEALAAAPASATTITLLPIEQLNLGTTRAYHLLKRARITTVGHLLQHTPADLLSLRMFGTTSLADVVGALGELGLELPRERVSA